MISSSSTDSSGSGMIYFDSGSCDRVKVYHHVPVTSNRNGYSASYLYGYGYSDESMKEREPTFLDKLEDKLYQCSFLENIEFNLYPIKKGFCFTCEFEINLEIFKYTAFRFKYNKEKNSVLLDYNYKLDEEKVKINENKVLQRCKNKIIKNLNTDRKKLISIENLNKYKRFFLVEL